MNAVKFHAELRSKYFMEYVKTECQNLSENQPESFLEWLWTRLRNAVEKINPTKHRPLPWEMVFCWSNKNMFFFFFFRTTEHTTTGKK